MNESPESYKPESKRNNVEGHPPLLLERRGEEIWTKDGKKLIPDFEIGPNQWNINLFVEYERTFGRGMARAITHHPISSHMYGNERNDYFELAGKIGLAINNGTEIECRDFIENLREYRNKYPKLFDDVQANKSNSESISWKNTE